ncbi:hypothetical protein TrST_g308 [Triparma strigata]|uniref:Uncharacterized protein n=1 Tax=Triparma strigata TaxID=1606541 RepID=A0A9W6ZI56_9STRA|nr:hypothetical protein TrST_g308 [Triparma strigata]
MSETTRLTKEGLEQAKRRQSFLSAKSLKAELAEHVTADAREAAAIALYNEATSTLKAGIDDAFDKDEFDKAAELQAKMEEEKIKACWRLMKGDPATVLSSPGDLKKWPGVTLNAKNQVVGIDWSNQGLEGEVPPQFFDFANLTELELSGNDNLVCSDPGRLKEKLGSNWTSPPPPSKAPPKAPDGALSFAEAGARPPQPKSAPRGAPPPFPRGAPPPPPHGAKAKAQTNEVRTSEGEEALTQLQAEKDDIQAKLDEALKSLAVDKSESETALLKVEMKLKEEIEAKSKLSKGKESALSQLQKEVLRLKGEVDATGKTANNDGVQKSEELAKTSAKLQEVSKMLDAEKLAKGKLEKARKNALAQLQNEKEKVLKLQQEVEAAGNDRDSKNSELLKIAEEEKRELTASRDELKAACDKQQKELKALKNNSDAGRKEEADKLRKKLEVKVTERMEFEMAVALEKFRYDHSRELDKLKEKHAKEIKRLERQARENPDQTADATITNLREQVRVQGDLLMKEKVKSRDEQSALEDKLAKKDELLYKFTKGQEQANKILDVLNLEKSVWRR